MNTTPMILIVVLDGMRPDLVDAATMPRLSALLGDGCWFTESSCVFPSATRVNATALGTGAPPAVNGVIANKFFDPNVTGGRMLHTGQFPDISAAESHYGGYFVSAPSLGDTLAKAGLRFAVVSSGSAGTAHLVNSRAARNGQATLCLRDWEASQPKDLADAMLSRFGPIAPDGKPNSARMVQQTSMFLDGIYPELRPDVALLWYNDPDLTFHYTGLGSSESLAALAALDEQIGRLRDWAASSAPGREVCFLVLSDHGHITAREKVRIGSALQNAGLGFEADGLMVGALGHTGAVRHLKGDDGQIRAVAEWLAEQPWCGMIFSKHGDGETGGIPGTLPRSLLMNDHDRSPDLFFLSRADDRHNAMGISGSCFYSGDVPEGGSTHGGLHRREMNNLLSLVGPGVRSGQRLDTPAGIIDVAPTVLTLLGLPVPATMTGRHLAEAFSVEATPDVQRENIKLAAPNGRMYLRRAKVGTATYLISGSIEDSGS